MLAKVDDPFVTDVIEAFVVELAAWVIEELLPEVDDPLTVVFEAFVVALETCVDD